MTPEPPTPTPRRKLRYLRWLGVLLLGYFAYAAWKAYDYRAAAKEARALGWNVEPSSPFDDIKRDWHAAMEMETWTKPQRHLGISRDQEFTGHESLLLRLNPDDIGFSFYSGSLNLSMLKNLPSLRWLTFYECAELTDENMDQIQELTKLKGLSIGYCPRLTHLNSFVRLKNLELLRLSGVPSIPVDNIDAFKAAHPNTIVDYIP